MAFYAQRRRSFLKETIRCRGLKAINLLDYDFAKVNLGNALDVTTGIFIAPVRGLYFFYFSALKLNIAGHGMDGNENTWETISLAVTLLQLPHRNIHAQAVVTSVEPYTWLQSTFQATVLLNPGDQLAVDMQYGYIYDKENPAGTEMNLLTSFTGYLMSPLWMDGWKQSWCATIYILNEFERSCFSFLQ